MITLHVPQERRRVLKTIAQAAGFIPFYRAMARAQGDPVAAATADFVAGLTEATRVGRPYRLRRGVTTLYRVVLPEGAHLIGDPGGSTLRLGYDGGLLANDTPLRAVTLENIVFDGAGRRINDAFGLLNFYDVAQVALEHCTVRNSTTGLFQHRCGGRVRLCTFEDLTGTAIHDDNCAGMVIDANTIQRCGDNGVHHWSLHSKRHDGSRISNNTITDIANRSGGLGLYGNGVRVAECGPVTVENNVIERCAYTAVRNTGGWEITIANNRCKTFGEKAMYAEFGFRDARFLNNVIADCGAGISATNYVGPGNGAGALISGNIVSGLRPSHPDGEFGPRMGWLHGVHAEGDARVIGNIVTGSPAVAILAGFFEARQNVRVEANRLIDNDYAIGVATQGDPGPCEIVENDMRGSKKANIVAMFQERVISGDLALPGAANPYRNLVIRGNHVL
ncbi:TIGR03808 family TAT-translocated repetitive protein [Rhodoblastus sp.]|uniref:TIGR03808 family TAT-translocated repetitive protein n=1 Tax=Rhodoblastus sp. TaxID=1962975 RepID=UPI0035AF5727